jgi:hypothetical protein
MRMPWVSGSVICMSRWIGVQNRNSESHVCGNRLYDI